MSPAYTEDSKGHNRDEFFEGRKEIWAFLERKWPRDLDYRLRENLWCRTENRIAVRFEYEIRDAEGQWWRSHLYDRFATPSRHASAGRPGPGDSRWSPRSDAGKTRATLTLEGPLRHHGG